MTRILCLIPTLRDFPLRSLDSLLNQTVKPSKIIVISGSLRLREYLRKNLSLKGSTRLEILYVKPNTQEHVGVRVGKAINAALENEKLELYDYILKMDSDVVLHPRCLELCIKKDSDLIGLGPFMLIKTKPFTELLSGRWPETPADDSFVRLLFVARGLRVEPKPSCAYEARKGGAQGTWRYYFYRGIDDYRTGINPISMGRIVVKLIIGRRSLLPAFTLLGYLVAILSRQKRFDFAPIIFKSGVVGRVLKRF